MKAICVVVATLLIAAGCQTGQSAVDDFKRKGTKEQRAELDKLEGKSPPAPHAFDWTNTGDKELNLADLKGKVVVFYLWGVWSPESKSATPKLKALHEKFHKQGLVLVGVHTTRQGGKLAGCVEKEKITWPVAIDKLGDTVTAFAAKDFPAYYLIDRKGTLRAADVVEDDLERAVGILLKE